MTNKTRILCFAYLLVCLGCSPERSMDYAAGLLDPAHEIWSLPAPEGFTVGLETTKGTILIDVHRAWAPRGADRFYHLVRAGYYDDSRISRVRAGFIAQFGIAGDPALNAIWQNASFPDDSVLTSNTRGTIAYAMTGPNTRTTQLYINYGDNARLDEQGFSPIGRISEEDMHLVDQFYAAYDEAAGGGMRGGKQGPVLAGGNAYLDAHYPALDKIIRAYIMEE